MIHHQLSKYKRVLTNVEYHVYTAVYTSDFISDATLTMDRVEVTTALRPCTLTLQRRLRERGMRLRT